MRASHFSRLRRRLAWCLAGAFFFAHTAAQACPGCKQVTEGRNVPLSGASLGFGLSIFFLLFMLAALLAGLGCMMARSCRALAARDAALLGEMDAATGDQGLPSRA